MSPELGWTINLCRSQSQASRVKLSITDVNLVSCFSKDSLIKIELSKAHVIIILQIEIW